MTKKKYRRYSPEFKRHVLKRASEDGVTDQGVCEELGEGHSKNLRAHEGCGKQLPNKLPGNQAIPGKIFGNRFCLVNDD